jgi:hypothetical protein
MLRTPRQSTRPHRRIIEKNPTPFKLNIKTRGHIKTGFTGHMSTCPLSTDAHNLSGSIQIRSDQNSSNQTRPVPRARQNCSQPRSVRTKSSCSEDHIPAVFLSNGRVQLTFYYTVLNRALQRYSHIQLLKFQFLFVPH